MSKNDFATGLFDLLEIAEKNLNSNYDHPDNYNNFIKVANETKKKLKDKYGDQWTDPIDGAPAAPVEEDDEWTWLKQISYLRNVKIEKGRKTNNQIEKT